MKFSPYKLKIFQNISWLTADQFIRMGMNALVSFMVARYYGKESYGTLNIALSIVLLFGPIVTLGYDGFLIKELLDSPDEKKDEVIGTSFLLRLFGAVLSISTIYISLEFFYNAPTGIDLTIRKLCYILSFSLIFQCFDVIDLMFRSRLMAKFSVLSKSGAFVFFCLVKLILIYLRLPLFYFAIATFLELSLSISLLIYLSKKKIGLNILRWKFNVKRAYYVFKEAWPLLVSNLSSTFYTKFDQLMIGDMLGVSFAGAFTASTKIYEIMLAAIIIVNTSLFPLLNQLYKEDREKFFKRYHLLCELFSVIAYGVFIFIFFFADFIVSKAFGKGFAESANVLRIQTLGLIFFYNASLRSIYLTITHNQRILIFTALGSAILNYSLNLLLIPKYGIIGSAMAICITHFCALQLFNIFFKNTRILFFIEMKSFLPLNLIRYALNFKYRQSS